MRGIAREVHTVAAENLETLKDLGATSESLEHLHDLIVTYDGVAAAPRDAVKNRATVTRILDRELRAAMDLATNFFDPMIRQFQANAPEFFEAYRSARGSFQPGSRAKLDENGRPVAKWRIALAAKKAAKAPPPKQNQPVKRGSRHRATASSTAPTAEALALSH